MVPTNNRLSRSQLTANVNSMELLIDIVQKFNLDKKFKAAVVQEEKTKKQEYLVLDSNDYSIEAGIDDVLPPPSSNKKRT